MWQPERGRSAFGCALGVSFAMMPVPFQMVAAALLAFLVRVNIPAAVACTWASNPLTTPLILFSQDSLGSLVLGGAATDQPNEEMLALLAQAPWPLMVGAFISGTILSFGAYPLALAGWDWLSARILRSRRERS
jgi:uncharacterized protein (DUF2062 family)